MDEAEVSRLLCLRSSERNHSGASSSLKTLLLYDESISCGGGAGAANRSAASTTVQCEPASPARARCNILGLLSRLPAQVGERTASRVLRCRSSFPYARISALVSSSRRSSSRSSDSDEPLRREREEVEAVCQRSVLTQIHVCQMAPFRREAGGAPDTGVVVLVSRHRLEVVIVLALRRPVRTRPWRLRVWSTE